MPKIELRNLEIQANKPPTRGASDFSAQLTFTLSALEEKQKGLWQGEGRAVTQGQGLNGDWQGELTVPLGIEIFPEHAGARLTIPALIGELRGTPFTRRAETNGGLRRALSLTMKGEAHASLRQDAAGAWQGESAGEGTLTLEESRLNFRWQAVSAFPPRDDLKAQFEARLNHLDIDAYWSEASTENAAQETQNAAEPPPSEAAEIKLSVPGEIRGVFSADWLRAGGILIRGIENHLRLAEDTMVFEPAPAARDGANQSKSAAGKN